MHLSCLHSLEQGLLSLHQTGPSLQLLSEFATVLQKLRRGKKRSHILAVYSYLNETCLEVSLGNLLVSVLVEVMDVQDAQYVFDRLVNPSEISWNSLMIGYVEHRKPRDALNLYHRMQHDDCVFPSGRSFVALLKACTQLNCCHKGMELHTRIVATGRLDQDVFVCSTLIDMYSKCGALSRAQQAFDNLALRNVVSWTGLLSGYVEHGLGEEAVSCFRDMHREGVLPNEVTYLCVLKACASIRDVVQGEKIHNEIQRQGLLERNISLGNALIDMYGKCRMLVKSKKLFDELVERDVVSWTALISSYVEEGYGKEALKLYEELQIEGIFANVVTFICILKACSLIGALEKGKNIHTEIKRYGLLTKDVALGNALVDMYAKCGTVVKAQEVFDNIPAPNVISWTTLITGYAECGHDDEALNCFKQMEQKGILPNVITYVCVLKICSSLGNMIMGKEVHAEIVRQGLLNEDILLGNALVDMYAKCNLPYMAQEVFDKLQRRNVASWNVIITGYVENEQFEEALNRFEKMQHEGVPADSITFISSLKACGMQEAFNEGREMHAKAEKQGLIKSDFVVGSAVVDMYVKCGSLVLAQEVFQKLPVKNVVSWTALIVGYAEHGHGQKALEYFKKMILEGVSPDGPTLISVLKVCGILRALEEGQAIHSEIERRELLRGDLVVGSALINLYCKCGLINKAREVFDNMSVQDVVLWSTLIEGYVENEHNEEALECYHQMQLECIPPNAVTFVSSLKACGSIGATEMGQQMHVEIERQGLQEDIIVGNTLLDMYVKCGSLQIAQQVFDKLCIRDVVTWTIMMAGHAQLGQSENVFDIFDRMVGEGIKPNLVTFIVLLSACNRRGLYDISQTYFESMSKDYGIIPSPKHHNCIIDLLGRHGQLEKAFAALRETSFHPNLVSWHALLGACSKWGNATLARHAFENAIILDEKDSVAYILMSNICADKERIGV